MAQPVIMIDTGFNRILAVSSSGDKTDASNSSCAERTDKKERALFSSRAPPARGPLIQGGTAEERYEQRLCMPSRVSETFAFQNH